MCFFVEMTLQGHLMTLQGHLKLTDLTLFCNVLIKKKTTGCREKCVTQGMLCNICFFM